MKTSNLLSDTLRPVALASMISCFTLGATAALGQQYQYPPGYTPSRYNQMQRTPYQASPAARPGITDRLRSAGQNVGDFIRRSFYGEPVSQSPTQPQYRSPAGSTPPRGQGRYSLDAPPRNPETTGFQAPKSSDRPKYVPAPRTSSDKVTKKPSTSAPTQAPAKTSKKYTPSKPSTFSKPTPKKVEDQPPTVSNYPAPTYPTEVPPTTPQTEIIDAENSKNSPSADSTFPLPGGTSDAPPSSVETEPTVKTPEPKETKETASSAPSSNSFMVGKKTSKPGRVMSPYAPYNELDITGLPSGSLALDPTTQKVFQVP